MNNLLETGTDREVTIQPDTGTQSGTQRRERHDDREGDDGRQGEEAVRRNKELPAIPVDGEMEMREKVEAELKRKFAALSRANKELATREERFRVAQEVRSQ